MAEFMSLDQKKSNQTFVKNVHHSSPPPLHPCLKEVLSLTGHIEDDD